jgi:hypothetical protein
MAAITKGLIVRVLAQTQGYLLFLVQVNLTGVKPEPLWEPSQKGWLSDLPQLHHQ